MPKLNIYAPGNFFTVEEMQHLRIVRVGGGTGFRTVIAQDSQSYIARARTKGISYKPGECDSELRFHNQAQLTAWENTLMREGIQAH